MLSQVPLGRGKLPFAESVTYPACPGNVRPPGDFTQFRFSNKLERPADAVLDAAGFETIRNAIGANRAFPNGILLGVEIERAGLF